MAILSHAGADHTFIMLRHAPATDDGGEGLVAEEIAIAADVSACELYTGTAERS